ncbi:TetR/AcrR family transcriptional regulator [Nocardiopsis lambiniae]|uniref:TetR family transcriptional regulator n=1 Tax=Nocardiopsis lambiniae TaxID=3075539 RepID=A0ABU2MD18_9ACTN|nr:TetR family transcriptional regulator [Nocardiopsis sp. DSM 44743]MDT0330161.1 TetR family transcriptional regulator [Nocardiopsis sp. DSM 44743]
MIERDGVAGVSHRVVSQEAGLPSSATTYYFSSLGDLLTAALTSVMEEDSRRMRRLSSGGDRRRDLAVLLSEVVKEPGRLLAEYELFLLAARRPHLREATDGWLAAVRAFAHRYTDDPVRARVVAGAIDGLLLHSLLTEHKPSADEFEGFLKDLLPDPE